MYDRLNESEILEYNAKYEKYADRLLGEGYRGIENALSLHEFVTILNSIKEWNQTNEYNNEITLNVIDRAHISGININFYIVNDSVVADQLLSDIVDPENYYFTFESKNIQYEARTGLIKDITMTMFRIT